ncbi:MAG: 50S ribosomal protein L24 [Pseudomonadota bacterium]
MKKTKGFKASGKTRLKQGDEVIIIAGKDKGKRGRIKSVLRDQDRVIVEGCQMIRKHVRPNPNVNEQGGIVSKEAAIHISNVMIFDATAQKGRRIGMKLTEERGKIRCYRADNELVEIEA